jgi:hypothetical protein
MKKNMGNTDRLIRSGIALLLAGLHVSGMVSGTWEIAIMVLAVIMLLTSVAGVCPLYGIFGINTGQND